MAKAIRIRDDQEVDDELNELLGFDWATANFAQRKFALKRAGFDDESIRQVFSTLGYEGFQHYPKLPREEYSVPKGEWPGFTATLKAGLILARQRDELTRQLTARPANGPDGNGSFWWNGEVFALMNTNAREVIEYLFRNPNCTIDQFWDALSPGSKRESIDRRLNRARQYLNNELPTFPFRPGMANRGRCVVLKPAKK